MIRSKLFREARNLGFAHTKRERIVTKGKTVKDDEIFLAECGNRQLHLVINKDGKGTVAHSVPVPGSWSGERYLNPVDATPFKDLPGMYRAIAFEWQRATKDAPKAAPAL